MENSALERLTLLSRDLVVTSGAVNRVKTKAGRLAKLRCPVKRLNHLEVCCRNDEPKTTMSSRRAEPDPAVISVGTEQQGPNRLNLDMNPRRVAAVKADWRRKRWKI